jgi:hypothetical protein
MEKYIFPSSLEQHPPPSSLDERSSPLKRKKTNINTPKKEVSILRKDRQKRAEEVYTYNKNVFISIACGKKEDPDLFRAHFVKGFFDEKEISALHKELERSNYWEPREDVRGSRPTTIVGQWTARGRNRQAADPIHPAGRGGLAEQTSNGALSLLLEKMGRKLSCLVAKKRGDIDGVLREYNLTELGFGFFHLFMAPRGYCEMHNDRNDFISVCVGINTPKKGGALELGGTGLAVNIMRGDVLIMDSDQIYHGSAPHQGEENPSLLNPQDRIVGIFICWRKFLRIKGFTLPFIFFLSNLILSQVFLLWIWLERLS